VPKSESRWQIRLALALYDVQTAHDRLEALDPADKQYDESLDEVIAAVDAYKRIVERVQAERRRTTRLKDES
jgi:hypothetical protein